MNIEAIRKFCMSLPHVSERVQWGGMLVFKIAKQKMFCLANLEPERDDVLLFFKATDEEFIELQEIEGIVPAPYMAKNKWVALERLDVLPAEELERLLAKSYELVFAKLPKREQAKLKDPGQGRGPFGSRLRAGSSAPRRKATRRSG